MRREGRISVCVMEYVAKGEFSIASWSVSQREIRLRVEHVAEGVNPTPYEAHRGRSKSTSRGTHRDRNEFGSA